MNGDKTETRARRRIRHAVKSRGYTIESIDYEHWYNAGEKCGIGGGWTVVLDRDFLENTTPGNDLMALSVDEMLAEVDYWLRPEGECGCDREHHAALAANVKGDPQKPTHSPECPYHIKYRLPWWPKQSGAQHL
jgi:hypothetical protein